LKISALKLFSGLALATTTLATIAVMWARAKWATSIPEVAMCIVAAIWGALLLAGRKNVRQVWVMAPLGGVIALAVFQYASGITVYPWLTRMAALYWAGNLATLFVAIQLFHDRSWRVRYLDGLVIFAVALAIFSLVTAMTSPVGIIYWTFHDPIISNRVLGPFLYVNQYAAFIELVLPIALYGALTRTAGRVLLIIAAASWRAQFSMLAPGEGRRWLLSSSPQSCFSSPGGSASPGVR